MDRKAYRAGSSYEVVNVLSLQQSERIPLPFPCPPLFEKPPFVIYERILPGVWTQKKRNREPRINRIWRRVAGFFSSTRRHFASPSGPGHEQAY